MAEANPNQEFCSICLEICKQPTSIACEHKFCLHCLQDYAEKYMASGARETIPCPICRTEIPYPEEMRQNPDGKAKLNMAKGTAPMCEVCKENEKISTAVFRCKICSEDLCHECETYHRTMKATRNHQLTEIGVTLMDSFEDTDCRRHAGQRCTGFCEDHQRLCCDRCFEEEHKNCAHMNKFKLMTSKEELSIGLEIFRGDIHNYASELGILANDREQAFQRLTDSKRQMRQEVEKFKDKVLAKVTIELTRHLPEIESSVQKDIDKMVEDFDWCNSMKRKVELLGTNCTHDRHIDTSEDHMLRYCLAQERLESCRKEIVSRQAEMRDVSFEFHLNKDYEAFVHLGCNLIESKSRTQNMSSTLPLYMKPCSERCLDLLFEFRAASVDETKECTIISVSYLPDRTILLFDTGNASVKLFTETGRLEIKSGLELNNTCHACVTETEKDTWIASTTFQNIPATGGFQFGQSTSKSVFGQPASIPAHSSGNSGEVYLLDVSDTIKTKKLLVPGLKGCSAVIRVDDNYYSTWRTAVKVISHQGRLLQTVEHVETGNWRDSNQTHQRRRDENEEDEDEPKETEDNEFKSFELFKDCRFIAANSIGTRIFVADEERNSISAFALKEGIVQLPPLFVYEHENLQQPSCITVNRQGLVFVSGKMSDNIHILSANGQVLNIMQVSRPVSISLLEEEEIRIVVGNQDAAKGDKVQVYRLF